MGATVLTKRGSTALSFDSVLSLHTPAPRKCCVTKARLQTLVFAALFHDLLRLKKPLQCTHSLPKDVLLVNKKMLQCFLGYTKDCSFLSQKFPYKNETFLYRSMFTFIGSCKFFFHFFHNIII